MCTGFRTIAIFCLVCSFFFVGVTLLAERPISTMMISLNRKIVGRLIFIISITFFSLFSFKTSRSNLCFLPLIFTFLLVSILIFMLEQEPRHAFNSVYTTDDVLPFCRGKTVPFPPISKDKYVVFTPTNTGTGNRILAMVSSYALALVTGRKFLVDWKLSAVFGAEFSALFKSKIAKPLSVATNESLDQSEYDFINLVYCRQCSIRRKHPGYFMLATDDFDQLFKKKFIVVRSNVYFAPALFANKKYRSMLCSRFNGSNLFYELFNELLQLSDEMQKEFEKHTRPFINNTIIGIQVRMKDRVGFPKSKVDHYLSCASHIATKYKNPMFFVASDSDEVKNQASAFFGNKLIKLTFDTREFSEKGIQYAVLDLMLLSSCKELILTPFSTFGAVAASIGKVVPHFITRNEGFCIKDVSSEPKFHYWHAFAVYSVPPSFGSSDMINQDDSFL